MPHKLQSSLWINARLLQSILIGIRGFACLLLETAHVRLNLIVGIWGPFVVQMMKSLLVKVLGPWGKKDLILIAKISNFDYNLIS